MAVILTNELTVNTNDLGSKPFESIFVAVNLQSGERRTVPLTDFRDEYNRRIFVNNEVARPTESFNKMVSNAKNLRLSDGSKINSIETDLMISANTVATELTEGKARQSYGLKQTLGLKAASSNDYLEKTKVFVRLKGDKDYRVFNASEIFVFRDGVATSLADIHDPELLNAIQNGSALEGVNLYVGSREVEEMDRGKFEQNAIIDQEEYQTTYSAQNGSSLLHKALGRKEFTPVEEHLNVREFTDDGTTRKTHTKRFELDAERQGEFIYVTDSYGQTHFVSINELFTSANGETPAIDKTTFATEPTAEDGGYLSYVGQEMFLKVGENFVQLQPLTVEQLTKVYSNHTMQPTPTLDANDIAAPGIYRKTKDGRYFEESNIQPLCYDYAEADFTHYLFSFVNATGEHTVVVPKTEFKNRNQLRIRVGNGFYDLSLNSNPRTLKRVNKPISQCAVVQTSKNSSSIFNNAQVLKPRNSDEIIENEQTSKIKEEFLEKYRKGEYNIETVYNTQGELVGLSNAQERYKMTDYAETIDSASENAFYNNFIPANLSVIDGKFKGSVTYDRKRANKTYIKNAKALALGSLQLMVTPLGFLTTLGLPILPIVAAASVASIPFAMVTNAIRSATSRRKISKSIDNPLYHNRIKQQEQFYENLNTFAKQAELQWEKGQKSAKKQYGKQAYYSLNKNEVETMLENFNILEEKIMLSFDKEKFTGVLHVVDGKADINGQNAYLAKKYEKLLAEKNKQIKKLSRQVRFARGNVKIALQDELDKLTIERDVMLSDYTLTHEDLKPDTKVREQCLEMLNLSRGYLLAKYRDYPMLGDSEQAFIKNLNVDYNLGLIYYKHRIYNSVAQLGAEHPEIKEFADKMLQSGKENKKQGHFDINNKKLKLAQAEEVKKEENLIEKRTDELEQEKVDEVEKANNNSLIERLAQKLAQAKGQPLENSDKMVEKISKILHKTNLTAEDEKYIVDSLKTFEADTKTAMDGLEQFKTGAHELNEVEIAEQADVENFIQMVDQLCDNVESCNSKLSKIKAMFDGTLTLEQANKLEKHAESLQALMIENQKQVEEAIDEIVGKIYVVKALNHDKQQVEKLENCLAKLKLLLKNVQTTNKEKTEWKKRFIAEQKAIISKAENLVSQLNTSDQSVQTGNDEYAKLKGELDANIIYGAKTSIDKNIKNLTTVASEMSKNVDSINSRIDALNTMQDNLKDSDDEQIVQLREMAQTKIDAFTKKKAFVQATQIKAQELVENFKNLKTYASVLDVNKDIEKLLSQTNAKTKLTTAEADIKYLANVIGNVKAAEKLNTLLQSASIDFEQSAQARIEEIKQNMPEYLAKLKNFVRANYNVFNDCQNQEVKEKYYNKIADYANIDHQVVFTMPENAIELE